MHLLPEEADDVLMVSGVTVRGSHHCARDVFIIHDKGGRTRLMGRFEVDGHIICLPGEQLTVSRPVYERLLRSRTMPATGGVVFSVARDTRGEPLRLKP